MIVFTTNQGGYYNDMADVVRLFFGMEKIADESGEGGADATISHRFSEQEGKWVEYCELSGSGRAPAEKKLVFAPVVSADRLYVERLKKRYAKLCLYGLLKESFGFAPPWGSLTGIRPTKLARQLLDEGIGLPGVVVTLQNVFDVSEPKARLVGDILAAQQGIQLWGDREHFDVYIGIPFCRTRCLYCSFFSSDMKKRGLVEGYIAALLREIAAFGELMKAQGRLCRAIYVGGGTPVAIATGQLRSILEAALVAFPGAAEFTVEAGRPDCVTPENMRMLKELGVGRVSINPQTMVDLTLEVIGRSHTAADVLNAYGLARAAGIPQVNMDIIVGLPGEGMEQVRSTLAALEPLDMDNLTVHTLAIKHSSRLNERLADYPLPDDATASAMLDMAQEFAVKKGMRPYYMYRQKYMAGNLENVGYALPGAECVYNIDMMEETHDIVALGAGAVSKRMYYEQTRHERFPNPKNINYYIEKIDELIQGKTGFFS
jgi:coproporphyrinogen dehydrogenase HemZ